MPLLGTDTVLAALMKSTIIEENASLGLAPPDPKAITALTNALATAIISHLIENTVVLPGIAVVTATGAGSTASPGMIS